MKRKYPVRCPVCYRPFRTWIGTTLHFLVRHDLGGLA